MEEEEEGGEEGEEDAQPVAAAVAEDHGQLTTAGYAGLPSCRKSGSKAWRWDGAGVHQERSVPNAFASAASAWPVEDWGLAIGCTYMYEHSIYR